MMEKSVSQHLAKKDNIKGCKVPIKFKYVGISSQIERHTLFFFNVCWFSQATFLSWALDRLSVNMSE